MRCTLLMLVLVGASAQASPFDTKVLPALKRGEDVLRVVKVQGFQAPQVWIDRLVKASIADLVPIIAACQDYVGLIPRVQKVILHKAGAPNHRCELFLDMPFPFSDMRSTVQYSGKIGTKEVVMRYVQVAGDYKTHSGAWHLRSLGKLTWVHYRLHVNPGQPLPDWLINSFTKGALRKTLDGITERLRR
jgi:hypothetical protein